MELVQALNINEKFKVCIYVHYILLKPNANIFIV